MSFVKELELTVKNGQVMKGAICIATYDQEKGSVAGETKCLRELGITGAKRTAFIKEIKKAIACQSDKPAIPAKEVVATCDDGVVSLSVGGVAVATYKDEVISISENCKFSVSESDRLLLLEMAIAASDNAVDDDVKVSEREILDYQEDKVTGGLLVFDGKALSGVDPDLNKKAIAGIGSVSLVFDHPEKGCVEKKIATVSKWKVSLEVELLYRLGFEPGDISQIHKQVAELYCYGSKIAKEKLSQKRKSDKNNKRKALRSKIYSAL